MTIETSELDKEKLVDLNRQIAEKEQEGETAGKFFETGLSNQLIFRRASGAIASKADFLEGLKNNPFTRRVPKEITVTKLDDTALVTLIVEATLAKDSSEHRYRNIRLFTRSASDWVLQLWYNYEITNF